MIKIIKVKNYTTNAINLSRLSFKYKIIQIREKRIVYRIMILLY